MPSSPPSPGVTTTGWVVLVLLGLAGLTCVAAGYRSLRARGESRAGRRRWWLALATMVLLPLGVFGLLAEDVSTAEGISWDLSIMKHVLLHHSDRVQHLMQVLTATGGAVVVITLLCATTATLLIARLRWSAAFLVCATAAAMIVDALMKQVFQRARPEIIPHYFIGGYSFPSGHTMNTMGFAVAVTIVFWRTRWRWFATLSSLAWAVSVGVSRVYLGVHFPSDVLGGWALAVAVAAIVWLAFWTELEADRSGAEFEADRSDAELEAAGRSPVAASPPTRRPDDGDALSGSAGTDEPTVSSEE